MSYLRSDAFKSFRPTKASIPPSLRPGLRMKPPAKDMVCVHPLNPLDFLLRAAQIYPEKLAIVHPDTPTPVFYTYSVWTQRVQNLAYALIQAGIKPGDRVAVIAPNSPMIADTNFGVMAARAIPNLINTRLKPSDVEYILEHSQSKLILVDHACAHLVKNSPLPKILCNDTGREEGDPYEAFLTGGRKFSQERGWSGLESESDENAGAMLCYTSGTTGRPKGVITTLRGSYLAAIANAYDNQMNYDTNYLWILPMFHAAGWTYPWANTFSFSTQITLRNVDFDLIWNHLLNSDVTHYCGAPTVQIGVVNHPKAQKPPRPVKAIIAGAAPTAHLLGKLEEIGITPIHVYGLTKTYGPFTRSYAQPFWRDLSLEERSKLVARQGHSFATASEVRVIKPPKDEDDETVEDVPRDGQTMGEIIMSGNIVMKEYLGDSEATRKAFRGGVFHSGDLAVVHPDGSVAIMDRSKDIIISGGENASSLAIEQELSSHPHVLEVAVIARTHPKWGERPHAFVILHPQHEKTWASKPSAFADDLKKHAKDKLPGFACPEWVEVVPELPKTSTGKIMKHELRKRVAKL
ncbi:AMP-dependent synthetase and ligase [Pterulicium gracile]|uniref:AMP-dependent synthetase and ligase n=1 Tax=Pterulicium gracile TaxID=1884261 RepID=A0A5C3QN22_9AGAR|nr:AMP-dependent synthetase and ligase [Pterula gracilis]